MQFVSIVLDSWKYHCGNENHLGDYTTWSRFISDLISIFPDAAEKVFDSLLIRSELDLGYCISISISNPLIIFNTFYKSDKRIANDRMFYSILWIIRNKVGDYFANGNNLWFLYEIFRRKAAFLYNDIELNNDFNEEKSVKIDAILDEIVSEYFNIFKIDLTEMENIINSNIVGGSSSESNFLNLVISRSFVAVNQIENSVIFGLFIDRVIESTKPKDISNWSRIASSSKWSDHLPLHVILISTLKRHYGDKFTSNGLFAISIDFIDSLNLKELNDAKIMTGLFILI